MLVQETEILWTFSSYVYSKSELLVKDTHVGGFPMTGLEKKKKKKPWRKTHLFLAAPQPVREYPVFLGSALTFTLTLVHHLSLSNISYVFIDRLYSNPFAGISTNILRFQHLTWSILASFQHLKPSSYKLNPQWSHSVSTLKMKMRCSWLSLWVF